MKNKKNHFKMKLKIITNYIMGEINLLEATNLFKNLGYKDIIVKNVLTNLKRKNVIQLTKKTTQTKTITPKKNNIIYFKQHQMSSKHISNLDEECFFEIIYNETENIDEVYFEIDYDN